MINKVTVTVDRPMGYNHHGTVYKLNYGFIDGIMGGDGEEQDAYIIDCQINYAVKSYTGNLIAVIERDDDVETKWIVSNHDLTVSDIVKHTSFIEKFFTSHVYPISEYDKDKMKRIEQLLKYKEENK